MDTNSDTPTVDASESFFTQILDPGSSFHPTFLLILDGAFASLLLLLLALLYVTSGNVHFLGLIGVELGLWASIKWWVLKSKRTIQNYSILQQVCTRASQNTSRRSGGDQEGFMIIVGLCRFLHTISSCA